MTNNQYEEFLQHHEVKGMRWGIRRYQPYSEGHRGGKEIGEAKKPIKTISDRKKKRIIRKIQRQSDSAALSVAETIRIKEKSREILNKPKRGFIDNLTLKNNVKYAEKMRKNYQKGNRNINRYLKQLDSYGVKMATRNSVRTHYTREYYGDFVRLREWKYLGLEWIERK